MKTFGTKFKMTMVFCLLLMGPVIMASAATITFRVNMSGQMALGKFNPASGDSVVVSGDTLNNWSSTASPLTVSAYNSNIYVGTFTISDQTGVQYKYVIKPSGGGTLWENISNNRWFGGTNGAQTVPISFFGNYLGHVVGADMSMVNYEKTWYTYKVNGLAKDPFLILKDKGFNFIRLRLLTSSDAQAQANPDGYINNLTYTVPLAAQVKAAGLQFLLDFTYCDSWGSGPVPSAWTNLTFAQLVPQMRSYNSNCIAAFKAAGAMPDFVQVGNELWMGFLCPYGEVDGTNNTPTQWSQFGQLMKAAIQGIADAAGPTNMPIIVIHCAEPTSWFFDNLNQQGVPYDVIGQSSYENQRNWPVGISITNTGNQSLPGNATAMLARYNKAQIVAEVSFPMSYANSSGPSNWLGIPVTPAGQVQFVYALSNAVQNVPGGQTPGLFWWGTEYCGYSWSPSCWGSMFDGNGNVLPSADAFGLIPAAFVRPFPPTGLNATAGNWLASLTWNTDGATSYNVKRSTSSSGPFTTIATASGTSYTDMGLVNGTTYYYQVSGVNSAGEGGNSSQITATLLPSPWVTGDIGIVGMVGGASYSGSVFTVNGSGGDIWNQSDAFRYAYQMITGDCDIRARVTSQSNTDPWAKTGVMIRETMDPGSVSGLMGVTPANGFQWVTRGSTGGSASGASVGALASPPNNWVRLTRTNNTITAYKSANGTSWTVVNTTTLTMASTYYVGLAVCSHNNNALCTATFDNVALLGTVVTSVGAVNPPSFTPSASVTSGTAVTATANAYGVPPLYYQWQTDGGRGGALTNIHGATNSTLAVDTTSLPAGAVQFDVIVNNSSQVITSTVSSLTIVYPTTSATLTDKGASLSAGANDISQLVGGGNAYNGDGLNYYSDNGVNHGAYPGQTFTTGSNPAGFYLTSVAIDTGGGNSSLTTTAQGYDLFIFSVTNANATLIAKYTAKNFVFSSGDWLQWSGFSLFLKTNTTYAYAFGLDATLPSSYAALNSSATTTDRYSGGQICLIPPGGGALTLGTSGKSDAVFDLGLTPIPQTVTMGVLNLSGGQIQLQWSAGVLLQATNLLGPWTTNTAAAPPSYNVTPAGPQMFYRLK